MPVIKEQVARRGIAAVTDKEWREHAQKVRVENARKGMRAALLEIGSTVARYFTPEEKVSFAQFAQKLRAPMSPEDLEAFGVPLAQSAGLAELEAAWRFELVMESAATPDIPVRRMHELVDLQMRRLKFGELGLQLERFSLRLRASRYLALLPAADAYHAAGDEENDLRVLSQVSPTLMSPEVQGRFLDLLLARRPQQLLQMASLGNRWGEQVANFIVAKGDRALAHAVVAALGRSRPPVWPKSYDALVGLYFAESSPEVGHNFLAALGDATIGERLGKPLDRNAMLAGDIWYYYGSRYGEYLATTKQGTPEGYLPAMIEQSPASASGYLQLADYYAEIGNLRAAVADYNHVLELTPSSADVHDRLAVAYFRSGARAEAIAQWKLVFSTLIAQINSSRAPESFWADFARTCDHLRARRLFAELKPEADALLRAYLRHNGNYRSNLPLHAAYVALGDPVAGTAWLLDLATVAPDPSAVFADIADASWIPLANRAPIFLRVLDARQNALGKAEGLDKENAQSELASWQVRWVEYLIRSKQFSPAADYIAALPHETRKSNAAALTPLELQAAAQLGTLDAKLAAYRSDPEVAPASEDLRSAARRILDAGDKLSARKILEFVFARELDEHKLAAPNFLGLAEIRIPSGDMPGALELLRRLVIAVGNPYENLSSASALLEKTGHNAEAIEFLNQLIKSAPWEPAYRLRLAKAEIAANQDAGAALDALAKIAAAPESPYGVRVEAATALSGSRPAADLGSAELKLLAADPRAVTALAADQSFFYEVRLRGAENTSDLQVKMQLLGHALAETPARDDARIPIFRAAVAAHSDEFAFAALGQIAATLRQQAGRRASGESAEDEETLRSDESDSADQEAQTPFYSVAKLSPAQVAQLAFEIGVLLDRRGRLNDAVPYLALAQKLEKNAARRKEVAVRIADVRARLRRQQTNLARQPILHQPLEQDRVVRPRILARAAAPAQLAPTGGE
jgi:predicted Zn-dependent protease